MTNDEPKKRARRNESSTTKQLKFVGIPGDWGTMPEAQQDEVVDEMIEALFGPFSDEVLE